MKKLWTIMLIVLISTVCIVSLGAAAVNSSFSAANPLTGGIKSFSQSPATATTCKINHVYYWLNGVKHEVNLASPYIYVDGSTWSFIRFQVKAYYNGPSGTTGFVAMGPGASYYGFPASFQPDYKTLTDGSETTMTCYDSYEIDGNCAFFVIASNQGTTVGQTGYIYVYPV